MATYSYNRDIPEANNDPSVDQPDMKINTNSIDDLINVDHVSFELPNGGLHRQVTLLNKTSVANPTGQLNAFTFNGNTWPVWTNALGNTFMLSRATLALQEGSCSLPGGLTMQWGRQMTSISGVTTGTINYPVSFLSAVYVVTTTPLHSNAAPPLAACSVSARTSSLTSLTSFQWRAEYQGAIAYEGFSWIAIGN